MTRAREVLDAATTERDFQQTVIDLARYRGWLTYHTHDSRRSNPGFPDLVLTRDGELVFAELKSERGRVSEAQWEWLNALREVQMEAKPALGGPAFPVQVYLWRPSDMTEIEEVLK